LREWLERHGLGAVPRLFQKLRIEAGWETAVEAVLRERLHALELAERDRLAQLLEDLPPAKASVFYPAQEEAAAHHAGLVPLAHKVHAADAEVSGALASWLAGVHVVEGAPDRAAC